MIGYRQWRVFNLIFDLCYHGPVKNLVVAIFVPENSSLWNNKGAVRLRPKKQIITRPSPFTRKS